MDVPGGGKVVAVSSVLLNNQNSSAMVSMRVTGQGRYGLYRAAGGTLTPAAVLGQAMPGGGSFKSLAWIMHDARPTSGHRD
jgi:hypothetical protein